MSLSFCLFLLSLFLSLWNCSSPCLSFHHLPFFPGEAFSTAAHTLTLSPTKFSIPPVQLMGTHSYHDLVRKNS